MIYQVAPELMCARPRACVRAYACVRVRVRACVCVCVCLGNIWWLWICEPATAVNAFRRKFPCEGGSETLWLVALYRRHWQQLSRVRLEWMHCLAVMMRTDERHQQRASSGTSRRIILVSASQQLDGHTVLQSDLCRGLEFATCRLHKSLVITTSIHL